MNSAIAATTASAPASILRPVKAILTAGLVCGTLDGLSALLLVGGRFARLFQFIASGALGPQSFTRGASSVVLGVAFHYLIALTASAAFYALSRFLPMLLEKPLIFGILYGVLVHCFMQFVVLPVTAIGRRPFNLNSFLIYLVVHMVVVGPSIALTLRRFLR